MASFIYPQAILFPQVSLAKNFSYGQYPQMQILKYMGNKRRLLNWLVPLLEEYLDLGDTVLDLFAGTSSIGYAMKPKARIIANDIQGYSAVISRALLQFNEQIRENDFNDTLSKYYDKNLDQLTDIFGKAIEDEQRLVNKGSFDEYKKFFLKIPIYGRGVTSDEYKLAPYFSKQFIDKRRVAKKSFPYLLFAIYYSNTFFSLKQCAEIDSLRYAIDQISDKDKQALYLSCLMFAMSKAVNSSGHFAEYLNQNSLSAQDLLLKQRAISIVSEFQNKLLDFGNVYLQKRWENKVYNYDYKDLVKQMAKDGEINGVKLIYIDPPYTNAQYSRFYHIPETLVRYDYPTLTLDRAKTTPVKGGYRDDRYQSSFSHTSKVEEAFQEMFGIISSSTDATLAISYSDNSLLKPVDKLIEIASQYYEIIDKKNGYNHSAQGSRFKHNGRGNHIVNEYLLICKRK
ncbi:DNA adenine methylase [Candidatus Daviesbacteria bacterium]|nr:DNA adenine methylase [Candidatus Daviesbacteria bacterium]